MKLESEIKRWERLMSARIQRRLEGLPYNDMKVVDALVDSLFRAYTAKEKERLEKVTALKQVKPKRRWAGSAGHV